MNYQEPNNFGNGCGGGGFGGGTNGGGGGVIPLCSGKKWNL